MKQLLAENVIWLFENHVYTQAQVWLASMLRLLQLAVCTNEQHSDQAASIIMVIIQHHCLHMLYQHYHAETENTNTVNLSIKYADNHTVGPELPLILLFHVPFIYPEIFCLIETYWFKKIILQTFVFT